MRIIVDTDPGVDDALALLLALAGPPGEVAGLTVVGGNVPLARGVRNALALLEYAGREDVPVLPGSSRPLRGKFPYAQHFHGWSGLSRRLPAPRRSPAASSTVDFLAAQLRDYPGQIQLAALGPLTNLAWLERQYPGRLAQAAAIVVMGGAVDTPGNSTPAAEFNFYSDPLAAAEVLNCGAPLTLVDLAACRRVAIERTDAANLRPRHRLSQLAAQLLQNWFRRDDQRQRFEFYDPLAMAALLDPALLTTRPATVTVETAAGPQLGESRAVGNPGPVAVADKVDTARFFALLRETLGWDGIPPVS